MKESDATGPVEKAGPMAAFVVLNARMARREMAWVQEGIAMAGRLNDICMSRRNMVSGYVMMPNHTKCGRILSFISMIFVCHWRQYYSPSGSSSGGDAFLNQWMYHVDHFSTSNSPFVASHFSVLPVFSIVGVLMVNPCFTLQAIILALKVNSCRNQVQPLSVVPPWRLAIRKVRFERSLQTQAKSKRNVWMRFELQPT